MSATIKESVARIFDDDFEVTKQMLSSLNPGMVVHFFHGWCLKDDTCRTICEVAKTNRPEAVTVFKSGLRTYILERDDSQTNIIDELEQIIDTFESAEAGEAIINLLKRRLDALKRNQCVLGRKLRMRDCLVVPTGELSGIFGEFSNAVAEIKAVYIEQFETINPLPFEADIELELNECWINLELINTKFKSSTVEKTDCLAMVNEAFALRKVVLCKGDPGCGKSTLCYYLCYQWGTASWKEFDCVLFARLRDVEKTNSILELAVNWMCEYNFFGDKEILLKMAMAKGHKILVILDGYDEKIGVCSQLEKLLESTNYHLSFNLLLTSCSWAIDKERIKYKGKAQTLAISNLVLNQQEEYAQKIIRDEHKVRTLMSAIKMAGFPRELAQNILLFSYICFYCITQKGNDFKLPFKNVDELYSELFARLVDRYEEKRNRVASWNWETVDQIRCLGKMAMAGIGKDKTQLSFAPEDLDRFNISECYCTGAGLLIKNCYSRPGASSVVYYSFAHRTAQEFLARKFMVDVYRGINATNFIEENVFNSMEATKSHPDAKDVVDQLDSAVYYSDAQLIKIATNDSRNVIPVAVMFMDVSEMTLIYLLRRSARVLYILLTLLKSHSGSVAGVAEAFKKCIYNTICCEIRHGKWGLLVENHGTAAFLDLCHGLDLPIVSVLENSSSYKKPDTLCYFSSLNILWYIRSSHRKLLQNSMSSIEICHLPQKIEILAIHRHVSTDWFSKTGISLRCIGCINIYSYSTQPQPDKPDIALECSTPVEQFQQENGITLPQLFLCDRHLPPPVVSSSLRFNDNFLSFYCLDWDNWSILQHYDKMQLCAILSKNFPMKSFGQFMSLLQKLKFLDLGGTDLDGENPMSKKKVRMFRQCIHALGPDASVKYDPDSTLGQTLAAL